MEKSDSYNEGMRADGEYKRIENYQPNSYFDFYQNCEFILFDWRFKQDLNGLSEHYDQNGTLRKSREFKNGFLNGTKKIYRKDGSIIREENWIKRPIIKKEFRKRMIAKYEILQGKYRVWYPNGQLKIDGAYNKHKMDGFFHTWYDNGSHRSEFEISNGNFNGIFRMWDTTGNQICDQVFRNDTLIKGGCTFKTQKGELFAEGGKTLNLKTGVWTYYYKNGQKRAQGGYQLTYHYHSICDGVSPSRQFYSSNKMGTWTYWYENGTKMAEGMYKDHRGKGYEETQKTGVWKFWDEGGTILKKIPYIFFTNERVGEDYSVSERRFFYQDTFRMND